MLLLLLLLLLLYLSECLLNLNSFVKCFATPKPELNHAFAVIFAASYAEHITARGNRNDNNTFHVQELQVFARPYPVCTRPDVLFTALTQLIHSFL